MLKIGDRVDNRGASLVLVIVCMLFVGIISAAVLLMTVGNNNNVTMTRDTSKNFYDTEDFVDDLKMYFQKIANGAATKAYADVLQEMAIYGSVDMESIYREKFSEYLSQELTPTKLAALTPQIITYGKFTTDTSHPAEYSTYAGGEYGTDSVKITFGASGYDKDTLTLNDITIDFLNGKDYQTIINTSLTFDSIMPKLKWGGTEKDFPYEIDKFIALSGADIQYGAMAGTINGSLYAKDNLNFWMSSTSIHTDTVVVNSKYVICGGIMDVSNGNLNFGKLALPYNDVKEDEFTEVTDADNGNLWVGNLKIEGLANMTATSSEIYLEDDISVEGDNAKFSMTSGGSLVGFSSSQKSAGDVSDHEKSSSIVINGINAQMDLSQASMIKFAGTAYTQVPSIAGMMADISCRYFVQGESLTYKSVQPLYLIPGSWITGIGRNPMTASEFATFSSSNIQLGQLKSLLEVSDLDQVLGTDIFKSAGVRYVNDTSKPEYFYVYWDFKSTEQAVKYFNRLLAKSGTEENLINKLYMMNNLPVKSDGTLDLSKGTITKLPVKDDGSYDLSKIRMKGNSIIYDLGSYKHINSNWNSNDSDDCNKYKNWYKGLKTTLNKSDTTVGTDLINTMFKSGSSLEGIDVASGAQRSYPLYGMNSWGDSEYEYSGSVLNQYGSPESGWTYELVVGSNISLNPNPNKKYVVVSPGNVTINSAFNGIVIAKGTVTFNGTGNYNCFANYKRTKTSKTDSSDVTVEYISEFRALLDVVWNNDSDEITFTNAEGEEETKANGNTILRRIFGIASGSGGAGGSLGSDDLVRLDTTNYSKIG
ncbi:MAG: hypothetical protein IKW90_05305 [Lachnospiraceae bacterium]|nr:hypothetical protein [Lachnospiraceae bacterium]